MRYVRGSKVEVFSQKDVPSGSWNGAEIICGNGHAYTVRYDMYAGTTNEVTVERVLRKFIRPSPPMLEVSDNWISGDIVEVFDNFCWKMATISKVIEREYFLIRLLGSIREFKVNKEYVRVRLAWRDNEWFMIGKGSRSCEDASQAEWSTLKCRQNLNSWFRTADAMVNPIVRDDCFAGKENKYGSLGALKRRFPFYESPVEALMGSALKFRLIKKEGRLDRVIAANPIPLPAKLETDASTREMFTQASLNNRTSMFSEMDVEKVEPNDAYSVTCSIGSCTVSSNNLHEFPDHSSRGPIGDTGDNFSQAGSLSHGRSEEGNRFLPKKEELVEKIHSLELHAYRCTMEALHASGPLSWEQESLVTNLRLSLHISNDEHLMELKNLASADAGIPIR